MINIWNVDIFCVWNTDPDRPKNDKATILIDSIQVLKDLTAEVNRLKAEYAALSEESREVKFSCIESLWLQKPITFACH